MSKPFFSLNTISSAAPITVATFGGRGPTCQQDRIDAGLRECGAIVSTDGLTPVDLVYANDSERWNAALSWRDSHSPAAKIILNVLDIDEQHISTGYNPYSLVDFLKRADAVTSISNYTQSQLRRYFDINSTVIYNPIKNITSEIRAAGKRPYPYKAMMVGRLRDEGKRSELAVKSMLLAGFTEQEVVVVGSESIGWGTYLGVVSDEILNLLYQSVDYVLMPSLFEGLGLPGLEALAGGAIPIICHDLTTAAEGFYPSHWLCYPNPHSIAYRLRILVDNPLLRARDMAYSAKVGAEIRVLLSGKGVAARILDTYKNLFNSIL